MDVVTYHARRSKHARIASSRHLCVRFCGTNVEALRSLLGPNVERVDGPRDETAFVTFASVPAAAEVRDRLHGQQVTALESRRGRPLDVGFADRSDDAPLPKGGPAPARTCLDTDSPPGLRLCNDFITVDEEAALLAALDACVWQSDIKRRVQHYGFAFDYATRSVNPAFGASTPIPPLLLALFDRMRSAGLPHPPDQVTVNEYVPGIGIKFHIDTHAAFEDGIASLSLGAPIAFDMRCQDRRVSVGLLPRSLLVMTGEARYAWEHGIAARASDVIDGVALARSRRVSVTLRTVRPAGAQCRCAWPQCESQSRVPVNAPAAVEVEGVVRFYNRIADHFVQTRHTAWPKVAEFAAALERGATLLDVGCGNGRHMLPARDAGAVVFGCDLIAKFVAATANHGLEALACDALTLPYRSHVFDRVLCVAVLHHLATEERRLRALQELVRVTALKGSILVTVWAFEQDGTSKRAFEAQDVFVPWTLPAALDPERRDEVAPEGKRVLPPSQVNRYCHVFVQGELEALVARLPNVRVEQSYYDASNWACVIKKLAL